MKRRVTVALPSLGRSLRSLLILGVLYGAWLAYDQVQMRQDEVAYFCSQHKYRSRMSERPGEDDGILIHAVHVPKAGGTSLRNILFGWARLAKNKDFWSENMHVHFRAGNFQERCEKGGVLNATTGIYIAHTGFGIGDDAPLRRFNIVVVREPVSRVVSFFNYLIAEKRLNRTTLGPGALDKLVEDYNRIRSLGDLDRLRGNHAPMSLRLMHHILTDQLAYLASYRCVASSPDTNPFNCTRPNRDEGECSVASMKALALANLRLADAVVLTSNMAALQPILRYHLRFIPVKGTPLSHVNRALGRAKLTVNSRSRAMLEEWLRDETDVYHEAERISAEQFALATRCAPKESLQRPGAVLPSKPVPPLVTSTPKMPTFGSRGVQRLAQRRPQATPPSPPLSPLSPPSNSQTVV